MKKYVEYSGDKSSKFWEVTVKDSTMTTRWGKLGSTGQSKEKSFGSADDAITEADKLASQKMRKGYVLVELAKNKDQSICVLCPEAVRVSASVSDERFE